MSKRRIVVVGGGVAGVGAAIQLALMLDPEKYEIELIERANEFLEKSSNNTPCRLGLGFHYEDIETAKKYLHAAIDLVKTYGKEYIVGYEEQSTSYLRRGRYFIVKDSTFKLHQILKVYEELREEYRRLVEEDPTNEVFGSPADFYRELVVGDYRSVVNESKVLMAIETAEQVLNWQKLKRHLIEQLEEQAKQGRITLTRNTEVTDIKIDHAKDKFILTAKEKTTDGIKERTIDADIVVNASWENIEALNAKVGFLDPMAEPRINRTKVMIEVELPEELHKINSMFFCFGPHCSMTNIGGGKAFITYEPVTNIENTQNLELSEHSQRLMNGNASEKEKQDFANKIISGVTQYIPAMSKATFTGNIKFGIVKVKGGNANIDDPNSDIHKRRDSGVEEVNLGCINNASMKLLYFNKNGKEVAELVKQHDIILTKKNPYAAKEILSNFVPRGCEDIYKAMENHLHWHFKASETNSLIEKIKEQADNRLECNQEFEKILKKNSDTFAKPSFFFSQRKNKDSVRVSRTLSASQIRRVPSSTPRNDNSDHNSVSPSTSPPTNNMPFGKNSNGTSSYEPPSQGSKAEEHVSHYTKQKGGQKTSRENSEHDIHNTGNIFNIENARMTSFVHK